jgi:hypothetical protein
MAKNSNSKVQKMFDEKYDGRVVLLGNYWARTCSVLAYCTECDEAFRQRAESLFRGRRTRCRCTWKRGQVYSRFSGHRVVGEWDLTDKIKDRITEIKESVRRNK